MKTGGTMNFLKRAGAILMLVAVFASSCNKYADDFKQLNTKLDALATTVAGVTQLVTDNAALKAQVTALQTAVAALPTNASIAAALTTGLADIKTKIDAITNTLNTVANTGSATKAVVDQLTKDLADLKTAVGANNTDLLKKIADLQTALNGVAQTGTSTDAATALTIKGLQLMLEAQKIQLNQLLANSAMYSLPVNITTDAEVDFYMTKIGVWAAGGMINGTLTIKTANISAAKLTDLRTICNNIIAVIGGAASTMDVTAKAGDALVFGKLTTVTGDYKVAGIDVDDSMLSSVGGNVVLNYDGAYESSALASVGGDLILVNKAAVAPLVGTTSVSFPSVKVTGLVGDAALPGTGIVSFPLATKVELAGGVSSLTAAKATAVKIGTAVYTTGLTVNAPKATTVDLSAMTTLVAPGLNVTADPTANLMLDNFATTVALPVAATIAGPTTISLPKYVAGLLTSDATTVTLAKHEGFVSPVLAAVTNLTMNSLNNPLNLSLYPALVQATISGKAQDHFASCLATVSATVNTKLTTVTFGGVLRSVSLVATAPATDLIKLTSITTSGQINGFTLTDADALTSLSLGHGQFVGAVGFGATGSDLTITNNDKLTSLTTTALDKLNSLTVTGNAKLAAFDFSSYTNLKDDASAISISISGNNGTAKTTASYSPSVPVTGSTPYQEAVIKSNSIMTLKAYLAKAKAHTPSVTLTFLNIDINLNTPAAGAADVLSTVMQANKTAFPGTLVVDAVGAISSYAEMGLVVAE